MDKFTITIEGLSKSGKSTLGKLLTDFLCNKGHHVVVPTEVIMVEPSQTKKFKQSWITFQERTSFKSEK